MPKKLNEDVMLRGARIVLSALLGLSMLVGAATVILLVLTLASQRYVAAQLASGGIDSSAIPWLACLLALSAAIAALAFLFVRRLREIVESVSTGDPFVPANADRLRRMAWLTLGIQALAIPMTRLAVWFDAAPEAANVYHNRNGISAGALVLALILFVLARVFRVGAEMREDLEGTI